ncbi:MAG: hypothetical protein KL863_07480 [Rhizobium sp.]|nr:hypothetical protein [Rhizobium sp.]
MAVSRIPLLANASATGNPVTIPVCGYYQFSALGTFGGATVKLQMLGSDGATYVDIADSSLTAAGTALVALPAEALVKAAVASGSPSGLYAAIDLAVK